MNGVIPIAMVLDINALGGVQGPPCEYLSVTIFVLITAPKEIIQDMMYNVRRESEFIYTLMEKSAY